MKLMKYLLACFVISSLLGGCSLNTERPTNVEYIEKIDIQWQQHLSQLKQITAYQNKGQIGYISPQERFSSRFEWQYQNPQNYRLKLYSLLSRTSLMIEMKQNHITISDNQGNIQSAHNTKQLLREIIGMEIPLAQLAYWLKGEPINNDNYQVGTNHLLATLSYAADSSTWTADYLSYHDNQMPKDILLKNTTTSQTLKIQIGDWSF
ncbi:lipoprotein insertase outer membrane protein LolB [Rodentibacter caecimuris]|uniref:Outer-membrane lipoprotein LolB n=1 Tax=Rodentibacter caecimuris TaxID=1796644 RepID=A0ABX3KYA1_9PAST|nr:lipoprotein localization factor LolB [Rodentibacter heylii]